jgi:hypothetical protein
MNVRFEAHFSLDFGLVIRFSKIVRFLLTELPLIGAIVKGIVSVVISRQVFIVHLPKSNMAGDPAD